MTIHNNKASGDAEPIDGRGELHQEDLNMFTGLSHTQFNDQGETINAVAPMLDLTNIDGDWNA